MQRWFSMVGVVMLVLMAWTGGIAHASENPTCIPASVEAPGHFDGDEDQVPSDSGKAVPHHHSSCDGHHVAVPTGQVRIDHALMAARSPASRGEPRHPGREPDTRLRPPIA